MRITSKYTVCAVSKVTVNKLNINKINMLNHIIVFDGDLIICA